MAGKFECALDHCNNIFLFMEERLQKEIERKEFLILIITFLTYGFSYLALSLSMSDIPDIWQDWFSGTVAPSKGKVMKNGLGGLERG